jgi:hypothetical protein
MWPRPAPHCRPLAGQGWLGLAGSWLLLATLLSLLRCRVDLYAPSTSLPSRCCYPTYDCAALLLLLTTACEWGLARPLHRRHLDVAFACASSRCCGRHLDSYGAARTWSLWSRWMLRLSVCRPSRIGRILPRRGQAKPRLAISPVPLPPWLSDPHHHGGRVESPSPDSPRH